MEKYYTRACNFYYGKQSKLKVKSKLALPLNGYSHISFDNIEIITRKDKKKIHIKDISHQNKIPVILGGEHSITYAAVNGIFKGLGLSNKNEIGIIQIDAHADLRERYENQVHSHASVMYLLGYEKYRIAQFGVRAISEEEVKNRTKFNIIFLDAQDIYNKKKFKLPSNFRADSLPSKFP